MKRKDDLTTSRKKTKAELITDVRAQRKELIKAADDSNMHKVRGLRQAIARKLTVIKELDLVRHEE